jgi:hypothetical protein
MREPQTKGGDVGGTGKRFIVQLASALLLFVVAIGVTASTAGASSPASLNATRAPKLVSPPEGTYLFNSSLNGGYAILTLNSDSTLSLGSCPGVWIIQKNYVSMSVDQTSCDPSLPVGLWIYIGKLKKHGIAGPAEGVSMGTFTTGVDFTAVR